MGESCVLGKRVVYARVKSFCVENRHFISLTTLWKMAAVADAEAQEPSANPTADELKTSMGSASAGPGSQR